MSIAKYKIRRLRWRREVGGWFADTSIGYYEIVRMDGSWWCHVGTLRFRYFARTLREAKAQCQEHFESKVRVFLVRVKQ